jgi:hypothetical protein
LKVIDLKIEEMRNSLKKSFFNSIMTSRDLIRNSGFIQLKIQNKCQTKKALIEKLMSGLKEDLKIFRVLKEFKTTYSKSRKEIERRAKFDYLIIGYLRIMIALIKEENQLRKWFLKENSTLLPQTFCPFLTNYLSEQIIKQLEVYFLNDTTIDELEEAQIKNFRQSLRTLDQDNVVFRLGELLEQYMACAESLSPIHQNLALGMHPEADLYQMGPQYQRPMKEECSQPHIYDVRRFSIKIRESDMVSLSNSSVFVNMGASLERSEDKYLNFTAEVERTFDAAYENGNRPTFVLSSFKQDLSANPSFALVN